MSDNLEQKKARDKSQRRRGKKSESKLDKAIVAQAREDLIERKPKLTLRAKHGIEGPSIQLTEEQTQKLIETILDLKQIGSIDQFLAVRESSAGDRGFVTKGMSAVEDDGDEGGYAFEDEA